MKEIYVSHRCAFFVLLHVVFGFFLFMWASELFAHERWILTPREIFEWNSKPKPDIFTRLSVTNIIILSLALLIALSLIRFHYTNSRLLFPDLQVKLASFGDFSAVVLRFCLAWALLSSAFAMEPRLGNVLFQSPTLLAPDLELSFLSEHWQWLQGLEIILGVMFLFGIVVRLGAVLLIFTTMLALFLYGQPMFAYFGTYLGVGIYLLLQGPGRYFVPLPTISFTHQWVNKLIQVPRHRVQFILRTLVGFNFLYLGIYFKVLQPNLVLGIIVIHDLPILSLAPEVSVLIMALVETLVSVLIIAGILLRPLAIILLGAFLFFASNLDESLMAHVLLYGVMITFLFNSAGHWTYPKAVSLTKSFV